MPAPTTTPAADLLIALAALHPHNAEIAAANAAMDFALSRALDEQQIGYLADVVSAAETLVAGQILVTIRVENTYATGQGFVHQLAVAAPAPADAADPDEWASEHLLQFTGDGPKYAQTEGLYEVEVIGCDDRPELVGAAASAQAERHG
ncbi:hypothetical protein [Gordonia hydrophobica]|uniref:Uncharacterized protein n=1 Tax=Gordonia hydrophobica TaxID=40516 RepID=A0ABZ2TXE0_9ACTN|nr:hypothetical protein [Gordonia hydrophobica]MBM7366354.1 hypothetical protein [Gordonia hydrophobica]